MIFTNHALKRLHERAPKLFKKYGFSLSVNMYKENLTSGYHISKNMSKIEIPPDAIGMILHKMERNNNKKMPTLYMLDKMVFVAYGNCVATVYPCDTWTMGFIQKFDEKPALKNYEELVAFACKNPNKVSVRFLTNYDQYDDIVELSDKKSRMRAVVKKSKTEINGFQLFQECDRPYILRVKSVDKCVQNLHKGSFIKNSIVVYADENCHYYYVDIFDEHFYVATYPNNSLIFLSYRNESQTVDTLKNDFESIKSQQKKIFFGVKNDGVTTTPLGSDIFEIMMKFGDFYDEINNKTLSIIGHCFKNYIKTI